MDLGSLVGQQTETAPCRSVAPPILRLQVHQGLEQRETILILVQVVQAAGSKEDGTQVLDLHGGQEE